MKRYWLAGAIAVPVLAALFLSVQTPELWGADANASRPERWLEAEPAPHTFIPFGGAYRKCIGFALAMTEIQTLIVRLIHHAHPAGAELPGNRVVSDPRRHVVSRAVFGRAPGPPSPKGTAKVTFAS